MGRRDISQVGKWLFAGAPMIVVQTRDPMNHQLAVQRIAKEQNRPLLRWSLLRGWCRGYDKPIASTTDFVEALAEAINPPEDDTEDKPNPEFPPGAVLWMEQGLELLWSAPGQPELSRVAALMEAMFYGKLPGREYSIVLVGGPDDDLPPALSPYAVFVRPEPPDQTEAHRIIMSDCKAFRLGNTQSVIRILHKEKGVPLATAKQTAEKVIADQFDGKIPPDDPAIIEACARAVLGLSRPEIGSALALSCSELSRIDPVLLRREKTRIIQSWGDVRFRDPRFGVDAMGGNDIMVRYALDRRVVQTTEAREFGLMPGRGVFLVGVPGCGKSLMAEIIASVFGVTMICVYSDSIGGHLYGESEKKFRRIFETARANAPCLLFMDELEKLFPRGYNGGHQVDSKLKGMFLSLTEENAKDGIAVYMVATANRVHDLDPAVLGRFDDIFFVDLPVASELEDIIRIHVERKERELPQAAYESLARRAEELQLSGREIEMATESALLKAFLDGKREMMADDFLAVFETTVPLAVTKADEIELIRQWGQRHAKPASSARLGQAPAWSPEKIGRVVRIAGAIEHEEEAADNAVASRYL